MANYKKVSVAPDARVELHDSLSLTGAEISINNLPAGAGVPFVHSHKNNEEIYAVLAGSGTAVIDGETVELTAGDWIRVVLKPSVSFLRQRILLSAISASKSKKIPSGDTRRTML